MEAHEEINIKSLYPSIKIPQETKSFTGQNLIKALSEINENLEKQQKAWLECRKELKQNNSFELKKIKVFLPGDLYKKNKEKDFKHLELHFNFDVWNIIEELEYLMHNQRIIQINSSYDESGYSYKSVNFSMSDLSDEEFDEFLKIFNIQGSCTSKINL